MGRSKQNKGSNEKKESRQQRRARIEAQHEAQEVRFFE